MNNKQITLLPVGIKCYRCDEPIVNQDEAVAYTDKPEGNYICRDCYSRYFFTCDECEVVYEQGAETSTNEGHIYCEACAENSCFYCKDCEVWYDGDDSYSVSNGELICTGCYDNNYFSCTSCNGNFYNDSLCSCDQCGDAFCESCVYDHGCESEESLEECQPEGVHHGKPGKYLSVNRLIGVEIEAEEGARSDIDLPKNVGIHEDGSLDETGVECVTPPASLDKAEGFIERTCAALTDAGYTGTSSCGLHVHIDVRDIRRNTKAICHLFRTVYALEDILFSTLPPSRQYNHYCESIKKSYDFDEFKPYRNYKVDTHWYKCSGDLSDLKRHKHSETRYHGLNIHSIFYRGTIEFRYHSGTVNPLKILYWSELLLKIVDYSINHYIDTDIVALANMSCDSDKFDRVCDMLNLSAIVRLYFRKRIQRFRPFFFSKGTTTARQDLPDGDDTAYKQQIVGV